MGLDQNTEGFSPRQETVATPVPNRRRAVIQNTILSYLSMALSLARNFGLVPLYFVHIGLVEFGAWTATGNVLAYLGMMDFGLTGAMTQRAAVAYGEGNKDRLQSIVATGLAINLLLSAAPGLLAAGLAPFLPGIVHIQDSAMAHRLSRCFLIVGISGGLSLFGYASGNLLRSFQKPLLPGLFDVFSDAVGMVLTIVMVVKGYGLYGIAAGLALRGLAGSLLTASACLWYCRARLRLRFVFSWTTAHGLWRLSLYQVAATLAGKIVTATDSLLIGIVLGPAAAGIYYATTRAHDLVRLLVMRIGYSFTPSLSHLYGEGRLERLKHVVLHLMKAQGLLGAVGIFGVIAFNQPFVRLWVGSDKFAGMPVSVLVGLWSLGSILSGGVTWETTFAIGRIPTLTRVAWVEALIRTPLTLALMPLLGLIGMPIAALTAQGVALHWLLNRDMIRSIQLTKPEVRRFGVRLARIVALPLLPMAAVLCLGSMWSLWHILRWGHLLAAAGGFVLVSLLLEVMMDRSLLRPFAIPTA